MDSSAGSTDPSAPLACPPSVVAMKTGCCLFTMFTAGLAIVVAVMAVVLVGTYAVLLVMASVTAGLVRAGVNVHHRRR
jgi:hypothetical protein